MPVVLETELIVDDDVRVETLGVDAEEDELDEVMKVVVDDGGGAEVEEEVAVEVEEILDV